MKLLILLSVAIVALPVAAFWLPFALAEDVGRERAPGQFDRLKIQARAWTDLEFNAEVIEVETVGDGPHDAYGTVRLLTLFGKGLGEVTLREDGSGDAHWSTTSAWLGAFALVGGEMLLLLAAGWRARTLL